MPADIVVTPASALNIAGNKRMVGPASSIQTMLMNVIRMPWTMQNEGLFIQWD